MSLIEIYDLIGYLLLVGVIFLFGVGYGQWRGRMAWKKIDPAARISRWRAVHDWALLATGESGSRELEEAWLRIAQRIFKIFCVKQHDYGADNIGIGGIKGVVLRMSDKIARLWELTGLKTGNEKETAVGESLEDALIDVADYGIIALMVEEGSWPLLDVDDAFGRNAILRYFNREFSELTAADLEVLLTDTLAADLGAEVT